MSGLTSDSSPTQIQCPHCQRDNYAWRVECASCHRCLRPAMLESGPVVLAALPDSVDDFAPSYLGERGVVVRGTRYTLKVARVGSVPGREPDSGYLAGRIAAMYEGERTFGIGVDTLASQYPYLYGARRQRDGAIVPIKPRVNPDNTG